MWEIIPWQEKWIIIKKQKSASSVLVADISWNWCSCFHWWRINYITSLRKRMWLLLELLKSIRITIWCSRNVKALVSSLIWMEHSAFIYLFYNWKANYYYNDWCWSFLSDLPVCTDIQTENYLCGEFCQTGQWVSDRQNGLSVCWLFFRTMAGDEESLS